MLSPGKLLLVLLILMLIFGAGRIAEIGKGLSQSIRNFKKGIGDEADADASNDSRPSKKKD